MASKQKNWVTKVPVGNFNNRGYAIMRESILNKLVDRKPPDLNKLRETMIYDIWDCAYVEGLNKDQRKVYASVMFRFFEVMDKSIEKSGTDFDTCALRDGLEVYQWARALVRMALVKRDENKDCNLPAKGQTILKGKGKNDVRPIYQHRRRNAKSSNINLSRIAVILNTGLTQSEAKVIYGKKGIHYVKRCSEKLCTNYEHVVHEDAKSREQRKGCQADTECEHDPPCIK